LDYLHNENIPVVAKDLLDEYPRKVYFFPDSGKVMVKKIKSINNSTIVDRESEYRMRVKYTPKSGDIELFT
jgi:chemotaxis protein CheD